ncbi:MULTISPECIES: cysteine desulfurase family protein [Pseudobutyrivibrio]|uniref:Cysteine desulfurase n=1 Tax=Pseudobutyrivibrio xylanivorans TaxID=185007 RepID=A0A1G5RTM6_PSEXY|nr:MULTISPECIES: cysteine desulfurase family protein [Pseudobutyrivibrio]MDC7279650.1 cysteine desulfurase [Butyrivibrio fibrisolvens]SCZ77433.1 cysteine desulfurase [Pseudobutyrivibrio xylanivorans]
MIYFDNSATTKCDEDAVALMNKCLLEDFGNPSSLHGMGAKGKDYLKESREIIAGILKAQPKEIYFTSGGTESNNLAIKGGVAAKKRRGNHIITTKIEHASVLNPIKYLEKKEGFEVTYLGTDEYGVISLDELKAALREDTIFVSIMMVNNEIGALQPIEEASKIIKSFNKEILFHVDAIQAFGKLAIQPKKMGIDLLTVSGHKIHGPKGSGFIYINEAIYNIMVPQILGGGHERGMRSGTENVPAIAALGVAAKKAYENLDENQNHLYAMRHRLIEGVSAIEGVSVNGHLDNNSAPQIVSVSIKGNRTRAQVILNALQDNYGIYVSAGSACSSNKPAISETLKSIGLEKDLLERTIRFSFCPENTMEEVETAIKALTELVPMMQL